MRSFVSSCLGWVDRHAIGVAVGVASATIVLGVVVGIGVARLNDVPAWWTRAQDSVLDESATRLHAQQLENAITTQLTMIRSEDDPRWTVAITPEQANAWLDARLVDTIVTHMGQEAWPDEIERVLLGVIENQLILGVRARHQHGFTILWAHVSLELDTQGELWTKFSNIHAGRTRMPRGALGMLGRGQLSGSKLRIGSAQLELGDGRIARLLALRVNAGRVELAIETTSESTQ